MSGFQSKYKDVFGSDLTAGVVKEFGWKSANLSDSWRYVSMLPARATPQTDWPAVIQDCIDTYGVKWFQRFLGFRLGNLMLKCPAGQSYGLDYEVWGSPVYPEQSGMDFENDFALKIANGVLAPGDHYVKSLVDPYNMIGAKVKCATASQVSRCFFSLQVSKS